MKPNIENLVTSLELSKELKELGVKQESLFYWVGCMKNIEGKIAGHLKYGTPDSSCGVYYAAFTAGELGEILPAALEIENAKHEFTNKEVWKERAILVCGKFRSPKPFNAFYCDYHIYRPKPFVGFELYKGFQSHNEAEARGQMLAYLIKNKLVVPK